MIALGSHSPHCQLDERRAVFLSLIRPALSRIMAILFMTWTDVVSARTIEIYGAAGKVTDPRTEMVN